MSVLGIRLKDRMRDEEIRRTTGVNDAVEHIARFRRWAGHIARVRDDRWTKKVLK